MERMLPPGSWELTLFEKNEHYGGTWYENTYVKSTTRITSTPPDGPLLM
jgi:cation diffusion facilitator CzcD-associated flavoprotein CzcO